MIKTAESVAIGHPDKVCDQISDAILDACLAQDPDSRVAIETMGGHGIITITGELTTNAYVDMRKIAQQVYSECGYSDQIGVQTNVVEQSRQIAQGVDNEGAGDQGIMVGYATSETPDFMPVEVMIARKFAQLMGARDGKSQATAEDGQLKTLVTSVCDDNAEQFFNGTLGQYVSEYFTDFSNWIRNPAGEWTIGGFKADTGLTGRKLAVDNYGPNIPIGGGCFSGKDATKVDRSAAYMARKIAVSLLHKFGAKEVYVHLAYAIGLAQPVMATATIDGKQIKVEGYDLRPQAIIEFLNLKYPQFYQTAKYGHFGNSFVWDKP